MAKKIIYFLFYLILSQSVLGLVTQAFSIFYFRVIVGANLLAILVLLVVVIARSQQATWQSRARALTLDCFVTTFLAMTKKIDWVLVFVVVVSLLTLYQVHYNYTGKINLAIDQTLGYHQVKNNNYPYPYFSDEWYAVSLVKGAIQNHSLPVVNVLENNSFFPNLELFFHSFISQITLLFGLNPLLGYEGLALVFNTLIILLAYLFLRQSNVSKIPAGISALSLLYITCGANIPGLWHLLPFSFGIIFYLFMLCFMAENQLWPTLLAGVFGCLFYPPLFLFFVASIIAFLSVKYWDFREKFIKIFFFVLLALFIAVPVSFIIIWLSPFQNNLNYILSRLFFTSFSSPYIPQNIFYNIIPIWAILLAIFGIKTVYNKNKYLFFGFILGIIFWIFYAVSCQRFMIEYERVAVFTAIITVLISGFGLEKFWHFKPVKILGIFGLAVFLIMIPFYTRIENWQKIVLVNPENGVSLFPKAPANNYLIQDDLRVFSGIRQKRFLSLPWKGTVIGISTDNFPANTKEGTISVGRERLTQDFLMADCSKKTEMAKQNGLNYIYLYQFSCPGFKEINKSNEGLVLYEFTN